LISKNKLGLLLEYIELELFNNIIEKSITEKKHTEKIKDSIIKDIFEKSGNKYLGKVLSAHEIKNIKHIDSSKIKSEYELSLENLKNEINKNNNDLESILMNINNLKCDISNYEGKISSIPNITDNYNHDKFIELSKEKRIKLNSLDELNKEKTKIEKLIKSNENKLLKYNDIESKYNKFETDKNNKINKLTSDIESFRKSLKNDNNYEYTQKKTLKLLKIKKDNYAELKMIKSYSKDEICNVYEKYIIYKNNQLLDSVKLTLRSDKKIKTLYKTIDSNIEELYKDMIKSINCEKINIDELQKDIIYLDNRVFNLDIYDKIKSSENKLITVKNKNYKDYEKYKKIISENDKLKLELEKINMDIYKNDIDINKINNDIQNEHFKRVNKNNYDLVENYKNIINDNKLKLRIEESKYNIIKINNDKKTTELNKLEDNYKIILEYIKKYEKHVVDSFDYEKIRLLIDDIFINKLLNNEILPKIEKMTNNILNYLKMNNIKINLLKLQSGEFTKDLEIKLKSNDNTDRGVDIDRDGHFNFNMYDLVFRMVLTKFNYSLKQDYLIIDEILDGASEINKDKIQKILEYFNEYYNMVLVITHDEKIKQYIDKGIVIRKIKDGSSVIVD
jgi:hypothetical protein